MAVPMKRRDVETALHAYGCSIVRDRGKHTVWQCPCGQHTAPLPRSRMIKAGVVRNVGRMMKCLPEGWLQ